MNKKPTVLITLEIKQRELLSKCYLANKLAKKGFRVYMGSFDTIDYTAKNIGPSIFFHKSTFFQYSEYYKSLGHTFVFLDEEGGLTIPRSLIKNYCNHRYKTVSKERNDIIFLPGKSFYKSIIKLPNTKGVKLYTTGWPRVDLWRDEFRFIYESEVNELKKKYKNYFLILSSFGMTGKKTFKERLGMLRKFDTNYKHNYNQIYTYKYKNFRNYLKLIKSLSSLLNQEEKIILRPHTSEKIEDWKNLTKNYKNVIINKDGDVTPWIIGSSGIIQFGSTTSIQAALYGRTSIQYKINFKKGITDTPSYELSKNIKSAKKVYDFLKKNKNKESLNLKRLTEKYLKDELSFNKHELAADKIIKKILKIKKKPISKLYLSKARKIKFYLKHLYFSIFKKKLTTMFDKHQHDLLIPKDVLKNINALNSKEKKNKVKIKFLIKNLVCIEN